MSIKVPARTIQVQKKLAGRLSPDLVALADKDESFSWEPDVKRRVLILHGDGPKGGNRLKVWGSNDRSRSGSIGLASVFKKLGIKKPNSLIGKDFDAEVKGNKIEIHF